MKKNWVIGGLALILLAAAGLSLFIGAVKLSFPLLPPDDQIFWQVRLPRVIFGLLVGAALGTSGAALQGILRNSLADPYLLGTSAGGGLGAAVALLLGLETSFWGLNGITIFAFLGALASTFLVYGVAGKRFTPETIILAGIAVGAIFAAALALIMTLSSDLPSIYFWLMGHLSGANWNWVLILLLYSVLGMGITFLFGRDLNIMLLGDDTASSLGVEVKRVRFILLITSSALAAAAVAFCGLIGFVGLMVPHIMRRILGGDHRFLLPASALAGGILLLLADTLARIIISPAEVPVGIVTAFLGAPFFLYLLRRRDWA